ncbi:helix-turn-helix transcriptional regulator [Vibrio tapetis subsp. quintayensis]|uniref:helix-turn-helix domain-containing protein n=1 Tax=Vibrio tapetis TaxID=52443 RepID=UPI0025B58938|nr:helix-turn-helix transcriptional regulator [Vibrio tapetis]MDN3681225.1 helix-turn-helix transcriptional regulator [Vibrio tapetis subsp. quintayensis]
MRAANSEYLLAALRSVIKTKGRTYRDLADEVGVPLSTFKRHLYSPNITLERLLDYCREIDTTLEELQKLAVKLQHDNESFFNNTQDEIFFQFPHLYDFYRELRHIRHRDSHDHMKKKYGLDEASTYAYFRALELLGLVKLTDDNKTQLNGPLYYRFSEDSKLSLKYKDILKAQALENPNCVRVGFSRMNLKESQLDALNKMLTQEVLKYHTENMKKDADGEGDLCNVLLFVTPHETLRFSEGIRTLPNDFLSQVRAQIARVEA